VLEALQVHSLYLDSYPSLKTGICVPVMDHTSCTLCLGDCPPAPHPTPSPSLAGSRGFQEHESLGHSPVVGSGMPPAHRSTMHATPASARWSLAKPAQRVSALQPKARPIPPACPGRRRFRSAVVAFKENGPGSQPAGGLGSGSAAIPPSDLPASEITSGLPERLQEPTGPPKLSGRCTEG
jgi:hypothetical protein